MNELIKILHFSQDPACEKSPDEIGGKLMQNVNVCHN